MTIAVICQNCGTEFRAQRKTRKFCSQSCAIRSTWRAAKSRECLLCGKSFNLTSAADANRRYCSQRCSKKANQKHIKSWMEDHVEKNAEYRSNYIAKHPGVEQTKAKRDRLEAIGLLGGRCVVCGAGNPNWLHIDYIPTTRGKPYRHPRHLKYIREHISDFRLLCANHHYELTLTGAIEGTGITQ